MKALFLTLLYANIAFMIVKRKVMEKENYLEVKPHLKAT